MLKKLFVAALGLGITFTSSYAQAAPSPVYCEGFGKQTSVVFRNQKYVVALCNMGEYYVGGMRGQSLDHFIALPANYEAEGIVARNGAYWYVVKHAFTDAHSVELSIYKGNTLLDRAYLY